MKHLVFGSIALLGVTAGSAVAADMPVKAPVYQAPAAAAAYNWTGFYIGGHGGGAWGRTRATDVDCCGNGPWHEVGDVFTAKTNGWVGGGQGGYNWQTGLLVFGIEGDLGYLGLRGSQLNIVGNGESVNTKGGFYATARGRLGFTADRLLVYLTGGYFGADLRSSVNDNNPPSEPTLNTSGSGFQSGWTVGGGVEFALMSAWTLKVEYLHFDLGTTRVTGPRNGDPAPDQAYGHDIHNTGDIVRAGINYKFDWGKGPVVSRY